MRTAFDSLKNLARAVILRAALDSRMGKPDAVQFFASAAVGGTEKVWFDLAGLRPKLLHEIVAEWKCA